MAGLSRSGGVKTYTINGVRLVSGLEWRSLNRGRAYEKEAVEHGSRKGFAFYALRRAGDVRQAGYAAAGDTSNTRVNGSYALASVLASHLGNGWIGAFEIEENAFAVLGVLANGAVIANLEGVFNREDAIDQLRTSYALFAPDLGEGDKKRIFAPQDFGLSDTSVRLDQVISPKLMRKEHRLRAIKRGLGLRSALAIVGLLVAIAAIGIGVGLKQDRERTQRLLAQAAELARQEEMAAKARQAAEEARQASEAAAAPQRPWLSQPLAMDLLLGCAAVAERIPLSVGGWGLSDTTCNGAGAVATYRRSQELPATVNDFAEASNGRLGITPTIEQAGEAGTIPFAIEPLKVATDIQLPKREPTLMRVTALLQRLSGVPDAGITYSFAEKMYDGGGKEGKEVVTPDWSTSQYTIASNLPPEVVFSGFDMSGIYVTEVKTTLGDDSQLKWTITGEIYAQ